MATHLGDGDWRSIAERASQEMNPAKLMILVENPCRGLEGERREKSQLAATFKGANEPRSFLSD